MTRARTLLVAAVAVIGALVPIAHVRADTVDAMNPAPNQTVDKDYPMIVGQDPQEATSTAIGDSHSAPTPDNCATLPSCNVIPLTFQVPKNFDKRDTYVATISLFFDRAAAYDTHTAGLTVATADYDLYLWAEAFNEPECTKDPPAGQEKPEYCTTDLAASGSANMPEIVKIDVSARQKFLLEVSNSGSAVPYRVHIESTYFPYDAPVESLGSPFTPTPGASSSAPLSLPSLTSGGGPGASSPSSVDTSLAALSPTGDASGLDSDVTGINGSSLSSIINSGPLLKAAKTTRPGAPPSGSSLLFWMLLVPLVLVAAAGGVVVRRRPRALRI
jgi:hypothetical protein